MQVVRPPFQAVFLVLLNVAALLVCFRVLAASSEALRSVLAIGASLVFAGSLQASLLLSMSRVSLDGRRVRVRNGMFSETILLAEAHFESRGRPQDLGLAWSWRLVRARDIAGLRVWDRFVPGLVLSSFGPRLGRGLIASHFPRASQRKQDAVTTWIETQ